MSYTDYTLKAKLQLITALEYPEYSSVVILCVRKETTYSYAQLVYRYKVHCQ